jgi:hypothetical protein
MRNLAVAVTGSRHWTDRAAIYDALTSLSLRLAVVIEGRQQGADRIAGTWAAAHRAVGIAWVPFYADWKTHGKLAGPIRNAQMVEYLLLAQENCGWVPYFLAFPTADSVGTWDMIRKCQRNGIRGHIIPA